MPNGRISSLSAWATFVMAPHVCLGAFVGDSAIGSNVVALDRDTFEPYIKRNKLTLVSFCMPRNVRCKKFDPHYEKAAVALEDRGLKFGSVDMSSDQELGSKAKVTRYPTLVLYEDGDRIEHDGDSPSTLEDIIKFVDIMTRPAVKTVRWLPEPDADKPCVVLRAPRLLPGFVEAAKTMRTRAAWYYHESSADEIVLQHWYEERMHWSAHSRGFGEKDRVKAFVTENLLPMFGKLDWQSFDKYIASGKGLVFSMFPPGVSVSMNHKSMMYEVARKFRKTHHAAIADTTKLTKEAIQGLTGVTSYPAIAVQNKAGASLAETFVFDGDLQVDNIVNFIQDVSGKKAGEL